jgi:ribonuclease-3
MDGSRAPGRATALTETIEHILGHSFARPGLLREAMTHRSAVRPGGRGGNSNERLEFIGDRVLGLLMAEWLIDRFPREQEGELGRRLALLVSQPVLAEVAETIGLGDVLTVSPGEARAGVRRRATVLADALEAALGALYLDAGLDRARAFIRRAWGAVMTAQTEPPKDAKTTLQEWVQARGLGLPAYQVTMRTGPPHAPVFEVTVSAGAFSGTGTAGSKRAAEQLAAEALLGGVGAGGVGSGGAGAGAAAPGGAGPGGEAALGGAGPGRDAVPGGIGLSDLGSGSGGSSGRRTGDIVATATASGSVGPRSAAR